MKLGLVVDGHWGFIHELLADWQSRYETEVFSFTEVNLPLSQGRVNTWRLRQSLKQFLDRNDLVFFEWAGPLLMTGSQLSTDTPIIARLHSWELFEFAPHICWDAVDRVILVSQAMQRRFASLYPDQAAKSRTVYCGKSLTEFTVTQHEFAGNIGMLCNLIPVKRVYEMVLMLHELRKKGYVLNLHLGGKTQDGFENKRYFASMQIAVEKLSLQNQVFFHGWVEDVAPWLQKMDFFISNSYWEGQQNALLEAMAVGCYCLSHFWDGAEEILPPEFLYATDAELQEKIVEYCELPDEAKRQHQTQLRSIVIERFDLDQMTARVRDVIEELNGSVVSS